MTEAPENRIRAHLERRGGGTTVELHRLMGTWGLHADDEHARVHVAEALDSAGIVASPSLLRASPQDLITLTLCGASAVPPTLATSRTADPDDGVVADPVAIPAALPRMLLTFGASLLALSLFLPWFRGETGGVVAPDLSTGWQWLSVLDVFLVLVVLLTVVTLATDALGELGQRAVAFTATVAMAATTFRIVAPPDDRLDRFILEMTVRIGPFAALLGLALIVFGAALAVSSPSREGSVLRDGQAPEPS